MRRVRGQGRGARSTGAIACTRHDTHTLWALPVCAYASVGAPGTAFAHTALPPPSLPLLRLPPPTAFAAKPISFPFLQAVLHCKRERWPLYRCWAMPRRGGGGAQEAARCSADSARTALGEQGPGKAATKCSPLPERDGRQQRSRVCVSTAFLPLPRGRARSPWRAPRLPAAAAAAACATTAAVHMLHLSLFMAFFRHRRQAGAQEPGVPPMRAPMLDAKSPACLSLHPPCASCVCTWQYACSCRDEGMPVRADVRWLRVLWRRATRSTC